jgi:hypothetical protein
MILEAYRRQHITQQFEERIKLQQNIASTHQLDENGRPTVALVFGDGMTTYTGKLFYYLYLTLYFVSHFHMSCISFPYVHRKHSSPGAAGSQEQEQYPSHNK